MTKSHARGELRHKINPQKVKAGVDDPAPTICEIFRRIWRTAETMAPDDPVAAGRIKRDAEVGYDMGKRMFIALKTYKEGKKPEEDEILSW